MSQSETHSLLRRIVRETRGPRGWYFRIKAEDHGGLTLIITVDGVDNYDPDTPMAVGHCHPVPHASYNEASWRRWILEQCLRTFNHEIGETLRFGPSDAPVRPFAPMHGPGEDPYTIHEIRSERDALTTQDGSLREGPV